MKNKIIISAVFFFSFLFFVFGPVQAITVVNPVTENQDGEIIFEENADNSNIIANVELYDGQIIEKTDEKLKISFLIANNGNKTHSDLVYAVELIEKIEGPIGISRAKKIYDEKVNLVENQKIKKEIEFELPNYLSGNFQVSISLADMNGLLMAINPVSEINLESRDSFMEIRMEKCYLTVEGELGDQRYSMVQGVVVDKNENLIVNCEIENHFNETKKVIPKLDFHKRTLFGNKININSNVDKEFIFNPNETKLIQFSLPKPENPQAYSVLMNLAENGNIISNQAEIHFVVGGASATIQNISLNKNFYKKGDELELSLALSGPADNFPNSRIEKTQLNNIFVEIFVLNSDNNLECVSIKDTISPSNPMAEYKNLETLNDCYNPQVTVVLRDEEDNILDERMVKIESQIKNIEEKVSNKTIEEKNNLIAISIIFIGLILFIISSFLLLAKFIKKNKN